MNYIIDEEHYSESFYFNNNYEDEESENIIKNLDENAFQRDDNINYRINYNKNKEKYKQYKINQNQIFPIENSNQSEIITTKQNNFFNISKFTNSSSTKNITEENKMLNIKRKEKENENEKEKEKKSNDKGHRKDTMTNRFKTNFFIDIQGFISKIMVNNEFCKVEKLRLYPIKKEIYNVSKASEILDLLKLKISDVLSKCEAHNAAIINSIIIGNVFPLFDIFNKNVKDLMDIYCGKVAYESYYMDLNNRYNIFISKIEKKKYPEYLEDFKNCVNNFENFFIEKNKHPRAKRKKLF